MDWGAYDWTWKLLNRFLFWLARSPDLVVFNSIRGQSYYAEKGFRPRQQMVIANGVDTQRFYPDAQARSQMRAELAVDLDNILIGTVGRIDPIKDLQTFIAVASRLIDLDPRYRFVIVGSGPSADEQALQQAIEQNKLIQSVVRVKQSARVHDYYNAMDIFVSCSRGEGFPNTVGEAMACGVPCIVTDVGDCRLLVGDTGVVVDIGDTTAIVAGVRKLESQISFGSITRESITKRVQVEFSVERLCSRSVTAFQALMPIE
jgi:glycosyltransferase involved in cell wall biosynthesis